MKIKLPQLPRLFMEQAEKPFSTPVTSYLHRVRIKKSEPVDLSPQVFVMESFFLRELIAALTPGANEEMHFLTGPKIGPIRVVSRMAAPISLEKQSTVFVGATAQSVGDVLIPIIEQGAELHICAHSHPGLGAAATTPSGTDIDCLGRLQANGSPAIGLIVTRDGFIRFFTVARRFQVAVVGNGVEKHSSYVFQITNQN